MNKPCTHKKGKEQNPKTKKDNIKESKIKPAVSSSIKETNDKDKKLIFDFNKIFGDSNPKNENRANAFLYLELMTNLNNKDDIKSLAICRLILKQEPDNQKIKDLEATLFETIARKYKENNNSLDFVNEEEPEKPMDKHMKLNENGEWEYYPSDEEDEK